MSSILGSFSLDSILKHHNIVFYVALSFICIILSTCVGLYDRKHISASQKSYHLHNGHLTKHDKIG